MHSELKTQLKNEVKIEIENLEQMTLGDDTYRTTVDGIVKLTDRVIEIEKLELAKAEKEKQLELEATKAENEKVEKQKQRRDEMIDKITKNVLTGISIGGGFALTIWGTLKTIEFEETGNVTTIMGRGFFNKLLHKN